jgi:SAM-dependent methyltransferase
MFFRERSKQAEYYDAPQRSVAERVAAFRELDRVNQLFRFDHPFISQLPRWLGEERCASLDILDVGAGTGLLGRVLSGWARGRGWDWRFTNLDLNPIQSGENDRANTVTGSALLLPFGDRSFDLVVASQMTHHLTDTEVIQHWREAWRVSRDAIFICDLHRNAGFYALLWPALYLLRTGRMLRQDGMISVRRGFHRREWNELAARAGIPDPNVWLYYGTRIVLQARRSVR